MLCNHLWLSLHYLQQKEQQMDAYRERLRHLNEQFGQLTSCISEDDTMVLVQRLHLLQNLWQEVRHQNESRQRQLKGRLQRWTDFYERCRQLDEELHRIEAQLGNGCQLSIEDLILALNTVRH